jgi:hypothetical protein
VLTTWAVVFEEDTAASAGPTALRAWTGRALELYVETCPALAVLLRTEDAVLATTGERLEGIADAVAAREPRRVRIAVSVVEVQPTSFDLAVRLRTLDGQAGAPADGRCTIVVERAGTGERVPIPREVRDAMVAIALAARDLC